MPDRKNASNCWLLLLALASFALAALIAVGWLT
jgi:hypothetical protein